MKKRYLWLICVLTLALAFTMTGCGTKETPLASASPSATAAVSPSEPAGTKPAVSPSDAPSAEPSDGESPEPSAHPTSETSNPSPSPKDDGKDYASLGFQVMENDGLGSVKYRMSESELIAALGEPDSKSAAGDSMPVRVRPPALYLKRLLQLGFLVAALFCLRCNLDLKYAASLQTSLRFPEKILKGENSLILVF